MSWGDVYKAQFLQRINIKNRCQNFSPLVFLKQIQCLRNAVLPKLNVCVYAAAEFLIFFIFFFLPNNALLSSLLSFNFNTPGPRYHSFLQCRKVKLILAQHRSCSSVSSEATCKPEDLHELGSWYNAGGLSIPSSST